jgi:hypothetical protein
MMHEIRCKEKVTGNAGLIRDQRCQTDPDAGHRELKKGKNADAGLTFFLGIRLSFDRALLNH